MAYIGNEPFLVGGKPINITMNDYWRWAYSDLADNINRYALAKFIVASSIGTMGKNAGASRPVIKPCDLISRNGYRLLVRAAAYVQSDDMEHPDHVSFAIFNSRMPDNTGQPRLDTQLLQHSDIYVFCVYKALKMDDSPLDLDFWDFYVLPTSVLTAKMPEKKSIALSSLIKLKPVKTDYAGLAGVIEAIKL